MGCPGKLAAQVGPAWRGLMATVIPAVLQWSPTASASASPIPACLTMPCSSPPGAGLLCGVGVTQRLPEVCRHAGGWQSVTSACHMQAAEPCMRGTHVSDVRLNSQRLSFRLHIDPLAWLQGAPAAILPLVLAISPPALRAMGIALLPRGPLGPVVLVARGSRAMARMLRAPGSWSGTSCSTLVVPARLVSFCGTILHASPLHARAADQGLLPAAELALMGLPRPGQMRCSPAPRLASSCPCPDSTGASVRGRRDPSPRQRGCPFRASSCARAVIRAATQPCKLLGITAAVTPAWSTSSSRHRQTWVRGVSSKRSESPLCLVANQARDPAKRAAAKWCLLWVPSKQNQNLRAL